MQCSEQARVTTNLKNKLKIRTVVLSIHGHCARTPQTPNPWMLKSLLYTWHTSLLDTLIRF